MAESGDAPRGRKTCQDVGNVLECLRPHVVQPGDVLYRDSLEGRIAVDVLSKHVAMLKGLLALPGGR
eukprot:14757934-Alexandrium_andersonii.AAC.1